MKHQLQLSKKVIPGYHVLWGIHVGEEIRGYMLNNRP